MAMENTIKKVIDSYLENNTRSEAEVRSKLIVPLTEALGFPQTYRGEDFPIYPFDGCKHLTTKKADYVFFDDVDFNNHSAKTYEDIEWVQNHSLLVIEAKKPYAMPEVQGQAQSYTMWAKALAYIVTDGICIKGWLLKNGRADELIIDTKISDYSRLEALSVFSFDSLTQIKMECFESEEFQPITNVKDLELPKETINEIREAMGRNGEGLDNLELVSKYLASCDFILQNELRYDIPPYAIDLLRAVYDANLYIDNRMSPIDSGTLFHSYWENIDIYEFDSEIMHLTLTYCGDKLIRFESECSSIDESVSKRIDGLKRIIEIVESKQFVLCFFDDDQRKQIVIDFQNYKSLYKKKRKDKKLIEYWLVGLEQMREIEDFYGITFVLEQVDDFIKLYHDVEIIYNGFHMIENCILTVSRDDKEYACSESPLIIHEGEIPNMATKSIFGILFRPVRIYLLPGKQKNHILANKTDLAVCCEYAVIGTDLKL